MAIWDFIYENWKRKKKAANLYNSVVQYSRNPHLFTKMEVEDSVDGRFDCVALHLALMLRRLKNEGEILRPMAVELVSTFVMDMDRSLREMGVGDLSVGKHIKKMTSAFYGRAEAYEKALEFGTGTQELEETLSRNLYRNKNISKDILEAMSKYVYETDEKFKTLQNEDLEQGLFKL